MKLSPDPRSAAIVLILGLAGCTSGLRPEAFQSSFLPPTPQTKESAETVPIRGAEVLEPPALQANFFPREVPVFIQVNYKVAPKPQLDQRIKRAEERYQAGKRLYLEGDFRSARVKFDEALDVLLASSDSAPDRHVMEMRLEEMVEKIHRYDLDGLGASEIPEQARYEAAPIDTFLEMTFPIDPGIKTRVKELVKGTSSELPLEENDEVLRYVNYFSTPRGKATLMGGLKRAGRYSDMIRRILDEEGVPQELIYLAQAESGFLPRAISHKAAAGMWQFMKFRGLEYGLKYTALIDERLDPEKATRAGARHLRDLYQEFGDWYLAMAAYNCGPGCVQRAVQRTGFADFWELRRRNAIPRETTNYVPLILAMTIMVKNAPEYGIENVTPDAPLVYDTVEMTESTSLLLAADLLDLSMAELRELNPALLAATAPPGYALRIPKESTQAFMAGLSQIPAEKRMSWRAHRVQDGETLTTIAKRYGTAPAEIMAVNRSVGDVRAGDLVIVPAVARVVKSYARTAPKTKPGARKVATAAEKQRPAKPPAGRVASYRKGRPVAAR